jgi:hypothetical protein
MRRKAAFHDLKRYLLTIVLLLSGKILLAGTPSNGTVEIKARTLVLPLLPANSDEARDGFPGFRISVSRQMWDLEQDLTKLYRNPLSSKRLPHGIEYSPDQQAEVRFLSSMIHDERYHELERPVLEAWRKWEEVLIQGGLLMGGKDNKFPVSKESRSIAKKAYDESWIMESSQRSKDPKIL